MAVDEDGNILIVEDGNHRIQKFTSRGNLIKAAGKKGNKPLEFDDPMGVAIHPLNKNLYIADRCNHRIQILNPDLKYSSSFGIQGSDNGQFQFPWDVAFDSTGKVYVADGENHRIQVFTAEGRFLMKFGMYGSGNGELNYPSSISIDSEDVVYVTENQNCRVSVFTCKGKFMTSFGTRGSGPGQFDLPRGITVDKHGVVCASDCKHLHLF